jgi:hypothetical protein
MQDPSPTPAGHSISWGAFSLGKKPSRCGHPSSSNAEVKNAWSYASTQPYICKARSPIKHGGKSHFLLPKYLHYTVTFVIFKVHAAVFLGITDTYDARLCRWMRGSREESQIFRNVGNYLPDDIASRILTSLLRRHKRLPRSVKKLVGDAFLTQIWNATKI